MTAGDHIPGRDEVLARLLHPAHAPAPLGAEGERAWDELRQYADWSESDFWLAFVFAPSAVQVHELQVRMAEFLKTKGAGQCVHLVDTPEGLASMLPDVLRAPERCNWVEALYLDPSKESALGGEPGVGP